MKKLKKYGKFIENLFEKNYEYLLLAEKFGFFKKGRINGDITTCDDWVVALWIDEICSSNPDKQILIDEILPNFKRWFKNGITSNGVGMFYKFLKKAELNGIEINEQSFECISSIFFLKNLNMESKNNCLSSIMEHFEIEEIITNLSRFKQNGLPLNKYLSYCYDELLELERQNEPISYDTYILFRTSGWKSLKEDMDLYEEKKSLESCYGYYTCNADEIKRLRGWLYLYGGYNHFYVADLEAKIKKWQEKSARCENLASKSVVRGLERSLDSKIYISYYLLDEKGKKILKKISGKLVGYSDKEIKLLLADSQEILIKESDNCIISKIGNNYRLFYECPTIQDRVNIYKTNLKIAQIKNRNVLDEYLEKYKTLEGLAYLRTHADSFIDEVDAEQFPIDNLFSYCFEVISGFVFESVEEKLQYVWAAYNQIKSGNIASIDYHNFGKPINKFLYKDELKIMQNVCCYIICAQMKLELPDTTTSTGTLSLTSDKEDNTNSLESVETIEESLVEDISMLEEEQEISETTDKQLKKGFRNKGV